MQGHRVGTDRLPVSLCPQPDFPWGTGLCEGAARLFGLSRLVPRKAFAGPSEAEPFGALCLRFADHSGAQRVLCVGCPVAVPGP